VLSSVCGVALLVTAGCEQMEINMHCTCFSLGVLVADAVCGALLLMAMILSISGAIAAAAACDPEVMEHVLEKAGHDSTNGSASQAAVYANFLLLLLEPMASGVCAELHAFSVYALASSLGSTCAFWSFLATCCLCCGCTDDGEDDHPHDLKALELHALMNRS